MQKQCHRSLSWLLIITLLISGALVGIGGLIMSMIAVGLLFACGVMGTRQAAHDAGSVSRGSWHGIQIALYGTIQARCEKRYAENKSGDG